MEKDKIREQLKVMLVAAYFNALNENDTECDPEPVCCNTCGQITMYSAGLQDELNPLDKLCLSDECINSALVSFAAATAHI